MREETQRIDPNGEQSIIIPHNPTAVPNLWGHKNPLVRNF